LPKQGGRINYLKAALGLLRLPRFNPLSMTTENKGVVAFNLSFLLARTDLLHAAVRDLTAWVEAGDIQVPKVRSFALADVAQAHQALESGETTGKLVLRTAPPLAVYPADGLGSSSADAVGGVNRRQDRGSSFFCVHSFWRKFRGGFSPTRLP
jgi:hypothetical protein